MSDRFEPVPGGVVIRRAAKHACMPPDVQACEKGDVFVCECGKRQVVREDYYDQLYWCPEGS